MNAQRLTLFTAFAALIFTGVAASATAETPAQPVASGETVYVTIEYFDPIRFDRMRHALTTGDDLILVTLKDSAAEQARFAGYTGTLIVLDEKTKPPVNATVLTLTWNERDVAASVTQAGKSKYLGIVNRQPISYHPDYMHMRQLIDSAGLPDARRDAALRAEVQMDLYKALEYLVNYQKARPAQN